MRNVVSTRIEPCQSHQENMTKKIVALAGDGIGPEIMEAGLAVLKAVAGQVGFDYEIEERAFGGAGIDECGHPLPVHRQRESTRRL